MNEKFLKMVRSKSGLPCVWERGGGYSNIGDAQIVTDGQGYPKRAIHVRTYGDLACGDHALIPVEVGDHVVTVDRHRDKVSAKVERIVSIQEDSATVVPAETPICVNAIYAAIDKSADYHCRTPYYICNEED